MTDLAKPNLKRYYLPRDSRSGWAIIVLDTTIGFFSAVSDNGNYVYIWSNPGCEFREFLTQCDSSYIYGKLKPPGVPDRIDEWETKRNMGTLISDIWPKGTAGYEKETKLLEAADFSTELGISDWRNGETSLPTYRPSWYEGISTYDHAGCTYFCERVWPRFVELLKADIELDSKEENATS